MRRGEPLRQGGGYRLGHDSIEDGIIHMLSDPFKGYHMGITAENLAEQFEVSRVAQDEFSAESQRRAIAEHLAPRRGQRGFAQHLPCVDRQRRQQQPDGGIGPQQDELRHHVSRHASRTRGSTQV